MIGNRLKTARLANALSLQDLSDALEERGYQITRAALSKFETGKLVPSDTLLQLIARTLGIGVNYFYWDEWPNFGIQLFRDMDIAPKQSSELYAFLQVKLEQVLQIDKLLGVKRDAFHYSPAKLNAVNHQQEIDALAQTLRTVWGNANQPLASVCSALEDSGWIAFELPNIFETSSVCGIETSTGAPFIAFSRTGTVDEVRQRILSELSYAYLSADDQTDTASMDISGAFARAVLLPKATIESLFLKNDIAPDSIVQTILKRKYGISKIQVRMRFRELGMFYTPMSSPKILESIQARKLAESRMENLLFREVPTLFTLEVLEAKRLGYLTEEVADSMLPVSLTHTSYDFLSYL